MKELIYNRSSIKINYIESAMNGSPILLLHGNMGRWQAFNSIVDSLSADMHVFALDLRGHGKSDHAPGTYLLKNHLSDVTAFIKDKIGVPVILFGMSLGGMISLMAAATYPELISSIIIADSPLTLDTLEPIIESQKELGYRIIHYLKTNQIDKLYKELNDDFSSESISQCDPDVLDTTFNRYKKMLFGYDIKKLLPQIKCPVLIMRGDKDLGSMINDTDMQLVSLLLPQLQQCKLTGVGHSLLLKKEIVMEKIRNFLASRVDPNETDNLIVNVKR